MTSVKPFLVKDLSYSFFNSLSRSRVDKKSEMFNEFPISVVQNLKIFVESLSN